MKELQKQPKAIVRVFNAGYSNNTCKTLSDYMNTAQESGYVLYQIMIGYAGLERAIGQLDEFPLLVIDNEYYKTSLQPFYTRYSACRVKRDIEMYQKS